jgi:hypothetical protein
MSRNLDDRLLEAKYELDKLKLAIEENKHAIAEAETLLRVLEENRQQGERDFARVQAEIRAIEDTLPAEAKRGIGDILISATSAFRATESLLRAALYAEAEVARQAEAEVARQAEAEVNDRLKESTPDKVEGESQGVIGKVKDAAKKASDAIKDATKQTGDTTKETH